MGGATIGDMVRVDSVASNHELSNDTVFPVLDCKNASSPGSMGCVNVFGTCLGPTSLRFYRDVQRVSDTWHTHKMQQFPSRRSQSLRL